MTRNALFTAGLRTPFTLAHKGALKDARPDELLASLFRAHQERWPSLWSEAPDDALVGCAYPEGEQGYNVARTAALGAGLAVPGMTLTRLCGSSLDAVAVAAAFIRTGRAQKILVGGVESMSRVPRRGAGFSEAAAIKAASPEAFVTMGETAEAVARRHPEITRARQEDFAAASHERAQAAYGQGFYADGVLTTRGGESARDESIRWPLSREKMASLPPAFAADGTVTAATSSPLSDGAASGLVLEEEAARALGARDGLRILGSAAAAVDPLVMGLGPVPAVRTLLQRHGLTPASLAAVEMNEAFAVQALACARLLELPEATLNAWGGALALGHPLGASGLRLVSTLHLRLRQRGEPGALGLATLCVGGGQGLALLCEYVDLTRKG